MKLPPLKTRPRVSELKTAMSLSRGVLLTLALGLTSVLGQDVLSNYVRIRGEPDDVNNGYVITEEVEDFSQNCVLQAKKIVEVCANGQ